MEHQLQLIGTIEEQDYEHHPLKDLQQIFQFQLEHLDEYNDDLSNISQHQYNQENYFSSTIFFLFHTNFDPNKLFFFLEKKN